MGKRLKSSFKVGLLFLIVCLIASGVAITLQIREASRRAALQKERADLLTQVSEAKPSISKSQVLILEITQALRAAARPSEDGVKDINTEIEKTEALLGKTEQLCDQVEARFHGVPDQDRFKRTLPDTRAMISLHRAQIKSLKGIVSVAQNLFEVEHISAKVRGPDKEIGSIQDALRILPVGEPISKDLMDRIHKVETDVTILIDEMNNLAHEIVVTQIKLYDEEKEKLQVISETVHQMAEKYQRKLDSIKQNVDTRKGIPPKAWCHFLQSDSSKTSSPSVLQDRPL